MSNRASKEGFKMSDKSVNIGYGSMILPDKTIPVALEIKKLKLRNKRLKEENEKFKDFIDEIAEDVECDYCQGAREIRHGG